MAKLAWKTLSTLREIIDKADDFVNTDDTLQALIEPRKSKIKSKSKNPDKTRSGGLVQANEK